jgi:hypothetical protein
MHGVFKMLEIMILCKGKESIKGSLILFWEVTELGEKTTALG